MIKYILINFIFIYMGGKQDFLFYMGVCVIEPEIETGSDSKKFGNH